MSLLAPITIKGCYGKQFRKYYSHNEQMGNASSDTKDAAGEPVILNVYDGKESSNMPTLGFGVYHTGLQVYGTEYVFDGGQTNSSGIRAQKPLYLPKETDWKFKESITVGTTKFTKPQVQEIVNQMKPDYPEKSYHITARNCNHFSDDLCFKLTGKNLPGWVNRAAKAGNIFKGVVDSVMNSQSNTPQTGPAPTTAPTEHIDLLPFIESSACLNETKEHTLSSIFVKNNKKNYLQSDADEQLLMYFNFKQNVKIFSLVIVGPEGNAPKGMKLFVNKKNMDFSDAESNEPTQALTLTNAQANGEAVPLKFVNFQNVVSLTVFIESNQGNKDSTIVSKMQFIGTPVNVTNMQNLKEVQYRGDLD